MIHAHPADSPHRGNASTRRTPWRPSRSSTSTSNRFMVSADRSRERSPKMKTIHHVLDIDADTARAWAALTQADGLAGWWSTKLDTDRAAVGTLIRFTFAGDFNPVM